MKKNHTERVVLDNHRVNRNQDKQDFLDRALHFKPDKAAVKIVKSGICLIMIPLG